MIYYHYKQQERMEKDWSKYDAILQKFFPENDKWGANVLFDTDGEIDVIEICKLEEYSVNGATWTHYCNIQRDCSEWELNTQFNGEKEDEMWVLGKYTTFTWCVRACAKGLKDKKPIAIY